MKIAFLVPEFPGQTHGFFWREAQAISAAGVECQFISTRRPRQQASHAFVEEAARSTRYLTAEPLQHPFHSLRSAGPALRLYRSMRAHLPESAAKSLALCGLALLLRQVCEEEGIDHVHGHSCGDAAYILALCRAAGGPSYSLTLHGDLDVYGRGHAFKFASAKFVTCVTHALVDQVKRRLPHVRTPLHMIRMGIDQWRDALPPAEPRSEFRCLTVARLNSQKGHVYALEAIRSLRERGVAISYDIVGTGEYETALQAKIAELELTGVAKLLGGWPNDQVATRLQAYDFFILPSVGLGEAAPVAVMEAMGQGVPVVCSIIGGTPEMIRDGETGLLTRQGESGDIAAALLALIEDPAKYRRIAAAALEHAQQEFRSDRNALALLDCIRGVPGSGPH